MQTIAEPHRQFGLLYLGSRAECYAYLKEPGKAGHKKKALLLTVEADIVLHIFAFQP